MKKYADPSFYKRRRKGLKRVRLFGLYRHSDKTMCMWICGNSPIRFYVYSCIPMSRDWIDDTSREENYVDGVL